MPRVPSGRERIATRMAETTGLSFHHCLKMVPHFIEALRAEILETPRVVVLGFGIFRRKQAAARNRHNPQNPAGGQFPHPATIVVRFTASKELRVQAAATNLDSESGSAPQESVR